MRVRGGTHRIERFGSCGEEEFFMLVTTPSTAAGDTSAPSKRSGLGVQATRARINHLFRNLDPDNP